MSFFDTLGIGEESILRQQHRVQGTVVKVTAWYFIKVNRKPLRKTALDGASFPHMLRFRYKVDGTEYDGNRLLPPSVEPPAQGDSITVFYDAQNPRRCALSIGRY